MEDTQIVRKNRSGVDSDNSLQARIKEVSRQLVNEQIENGRIDLQTASFRQIEVLSHEIGQQIARQLGQHLTEKQADQHIADQYPCPTCGRECHPIKRPREMIMVDGPTEIIELKCDCPKCRRSFFPTSRHHQTE